MSKVKDPRTKKRLSLKRDHRPLKPQAQAVLRKPIAKAAVHQRLRRAEHAALHALEALEARESAELAELAVREARSAGRGVRQKRRAVSLAQHLDIKLGRVTRRKRAAAAKRGPRTRRARASTGQGRRARRPAR